MSTLISVLLVIVCILLMLVVLVQNPKGGGLSSAFGASNQVMGVRKTADFLEKATWTLAIALLVLSLISTPYSKPQTVEAGVETESVTRKKAEDDPLLAPTGLNQNIPTPTVGDSAQ